ncbi:phosphotransferase [Bacillus sp. MUM 13]|uniref:phosphotransferase n=1 Tax=Bacillus sp. MUM 13 TaxID=1678001 RepID=UPI0008F5A26A|nr:phosphotransferase [Bacillus sp. MUM 13]OIK09580.1 hypothetical protein BIV59_16575 [Bacillus sp. MUM 13]
MDCLLEQLKKEPMLRYIPNKNEIEKLCEQYKIGELVTIDGELGGLFNVNLKINTTIGNYVIRVHSGLSSEIHLLAEKHLLKKLIEQDIPVLTPLNTTNGSYFSTLHNRFVQITPFVQGIPFIFSNEQVYRCGNLLKKFHNALIREEEIPTPNWSNYPSHRVLKQGIYQLVKLQRYIHEPPLITEVERLYEKVMNEWSCLNGDSLKKVVIHGDWHPWNVLFNDKNEIKYILDFDFLQKGERIHDIAYFLWTIRNEKNKKKLGEHFLKGYGPLTTSEIELLPIAIARASLFFLCTASFVANPGRELNEQMQVQKPYIEYLLSDNGKTSIKQLIN